jgi:hypothetical protein
VHASIRRNGAVQHDGGAAGVDNLPLGCAPLGAGDGSGCQNDEDGK